MKMKATLFALMLINLALYAQPVVSEFWVPQIGDNWDQSATNAHPDHGPGGANMTWDFSEADTSGFLGSFTFHWIDTTGTPYIDSFPDANICAKLGVGSFATYNYYREDDQGFHNLGGGSQFQTQILYEPQTFDYIGLMYTETAVDSYKVVVYSTFSDPDSILGFSSFQYDGYGTLLLPGEVSIENAIRIHEYDIRYDSTDNFGSANVTLDSLETYAWIAEGSVFPVAQWQRSVVHTRQYILGNLFSETVDGPDTTFAYNPNYTTTAVKSVADRPELKAYPTIVDQMITIDGLPQDNQSYGIYSMNGRLIDQGQVEGNVIYVPDISPGSYVLTVGEFKPFLFLKQ